jgi:hypothetical protein
MSRTLKLPDPVYKALQEVAEASGTTPVDWIAATPTRYKHGEELKHTGEG